MPQTISQIAPEGNFNLLLRFGTHYNSAQKPAKTNLIAPDYLIPLLQSIHKYIDRESVDFVFKKADELSIYLFGQEISQGEASFQKLKEKYCASVKDPFELL